MPECKHTSDRIALCYRQASSEYALLTPSHTHPSWRSRAVRFGSRVYETSRSHEIVRSGERSRYAAAGGRSSRRARERDDAREVQLLDNPSGLDANRSHIPTNTQPPRARIGRRRRPTTHTVACGRFRTVPNLHIGIARRFASVSPRDRRRWPRQAAPHEATGAGLVSTLPYRGSPQQPAEKSLANSGSNPLDTSPYRLETTADLHRIGGAPSQPPKIVRRAPGACGRTRDPDRVTHPNDHESKRTRL